MLALRTGSGGAFIFGGYTRKTRVVYAENAYGLAGLGLHAGNPCRLCEHSGSPADVAVFGSVLGSFPFVFDLDLSLSSFIDFPCNVALRSEGG